MARGRKTSLTIRLTPAERRTLLAWQRATTISAGLARRARIILLLADGVTITDIAATVGITRAGCGLPEAKMGWCSPLPGGHHLDGPLCACMEHLVSAERGEHCPLA